MPRRSATNDGRAPGAAGQLEPRADHDDLRSFITISRADPRDIGDRQVFARLDGGTPIVLLFGESVTEEIRPGSHHLRVHNTLTWRNRTFAVEPGEHLEFSILNSGRWWTYGVAGVLGAAPLFLTVEIRIRR